jgi:hypothetical protein
MIKKESRTAYRPILQPIATDLNPALVSYIVQWTKKPTVRSGKLSNVGPTGSIPAGCKLFSSENPKISEKPEI